MGHWAEDRVLTRMLCFNVSHVHHCNTNLLMSDVSPACGGWGLSVISMRRHVHLLWFVLMRLKMNLLVATLCVCIRAEFLAPPQ
jgi:hypothetical protein